MRFDTLHVLAIKGMARADTLAACLGREPDELGRLRADGLADHLERRGLWRLTPAGQARHTDLLADDLPAAARDRLYPGYQRFLPLNQLVKVACTRWQLRDGAPNDHADAAYDQVLVTELGDLHERVLPVVAELSAVRVRFARYGERLTAALDRLRAGDVTAFTGVMRESYHDIWMELHRDLLLSLRLERESEERVA